MIFSGSRKIESVEELQVHLQFAIGLELSTIPVYLTALYSIFDGENTIASRVIRSVVIEEMLHMALAANVLNAIGGEPSPDQIKGIGDPIPHFPTKIPFLPSLGQIDLQRFSRGALETFLEIEHPGVVATKQLEVGYSSIGAFYAAISQGIVNHCTPEVFESALEKRAGCQIAPTAYYGGAGELVTVTDRESALKAIQKIVHQGEGIQEQRMKETAEEHRSLKDGTAVDDDDILANGWKMYSHFARFREIQTGRRYCPSQAIGEEPSGDVLPINWDAVYPMAKNPQAKDYANTVVQPAVDRFNTTYSTLINNLYAAFNGASGEMSDAVNVMWQLKYQAVALMKTPSPLQKGVTVGAPFEYQR